MKTFAFAAVSALAIVASPALAQDVGTTIIGSDGAPVGTVASNDGTKVVVNTGTNEVALGADVFAEREGEWLIGVTKAQLDAAFEAQQAQLAEQQAAEQAAAEQAAAEALAVALVEGAEVVSLDMQPLGTVKTIKSDGIVIDNPAQPMTLPRNLFTVNEEGALVVQVNHADIMAALNGTPNAEAATDAG